MNVVDNYLMKPGCTLGLLIIFCALFSTCSEEPEILKRENRVPFFTSGSFEFFERPFPQQFVGNIPASDYDGDQLTFVINNGNTNNAFTINSLGQLLIETPGAINF